MEPLVANSAAAVVRPAAGAIQSDLAAVLRNGRVLAGEVLQSPGDGTLLIAIGRHRVPAESNLRLDPGHHFLFRVDAKSDEVVLRLLGYGDPEESSLLRALRSVIGEDRPIGELLSSLAAQLRSSLGGTGEPLAELRALLASLDQHAFQPEKGAGGLMQLFARSGMRYEASLLAAVRHGVSPDLLARLAGDLKLELLRAFEKLADGPVRDSVARTLAGLEAEQLLNLARQRAGEPLVWSLPLPDGNAWSTARLVVHQRRESEADSDEPGDDSQRVVLGVSFTNTGPIRVDLMLARSSLAVRVLTTRANVAERIRLDFEQLRERLGDGARSVHLFARAGEPAEVAVAAHPLDISFLREHRLMDVSG